MKIASTGSNGRVGQYLVKRGVLPLRCDVQDSVAVEKEINRVRPDIILHLAAKSNIDWCEKTKNLLKMVGVNVNGTYNVFEMAEKHGIPTVLFSSAHVFTGKKWWGTYKETDEPTIPCNQYGLTKLSAEGISYGFDNAKIIRTSYLFDKTRLNDDVQVILGEKSDKTYPTFMRRSFLYIPHFVNMVFEYCNRFAQMPKILHLSGVDSVSWHEFVRDIARFGYNNSGKNVRPRRKDLSGEYASRGHNLGLNVTESLRLGFEHYSYIDGIKEMTSGT